MVLLFVLDVRSRDVGLCVCWAHSVGLSVCWAYRVGLVFAGLTVWVKCLLGLLCGFVCWLA